MKTMLNPITQNRRAVFATTPIVLILVITLITPVALAATTIPASAFNTVGTFTWYPADKLYNASEDTFYFKVDNNLTYNPDTTAPAKLRLAQDTSGSGIYLDIYMFKDGTLELRYPDANTLLTQLAAAWNSDEPLYFYFEPDEDGCILKITRGNSEIFKDTLTSGLIVGSVVAIGGKATDTDPNVADGGNITFEFGTWTSFRPLTELMLVVVPVVVLIGVVGMVTKMIAKVAK